MSTRSTTHILAGDPAQPEAIIYRHTDGYPEGHGLDLRRFFDDVEASTSDTRYNDPSYLAAKLVVWLAREFATSGEFTPDGYVRTSHADSRPFDFLSVGIMREDPGDIEYIYEIDCSRHGDDGRPLVACFETTHPDGWPGPVGKGREVPIPAEVPADA